MLANVQRDASTGRFTTNVGWRPQRGVIKSNLSHLIVEKPDEKDVKELTKKVCKLNIDNESKEKVLKIVNYVDISKKYGIVQLDDIDFYNSDKPFTCVLYGQSESGKSTLLMHLYDKYFIKTRITTLYTHSDHIKHYQNKKNLIIRKGFNNDDRKLIESHKLINSKTNNEYPFLELFDDVVNIKGGIGKDGEDSLMTSLILYYRNSNVSTIISTQYEKLVSRQNRSNVHSMAFFGFINQDAIKELINDYLKSYFLLILGRNATMTDMLELYMDATSNYGFLYLVPKERRLDFIKLKLKNPI